MEQYISKAALVAEIERLQETTMDKNRNFLSSYHSGVFDALSMLENFLDTLEVKDGVASIDPISPNSLKISRHGNSHVEAMTEALRTEYEKGRADVLRCIDPDEMVADFCSQPLSKTRSLASIYRQGIMDILKRINNNEETSITSTRSIDDCGL